MKKVEGKWQIILLWNLNNNRVERWAGQEKTEMTRARKFLQVTRAQNYGVSCRKIGWAHAILWRHFFPIGSRWLMQFSDTTHPLAKKSNFPTTTTDESIVQLWSCTKRTGGFGSQRKTPKVGIKKWSILGKKCISHYINFFESTQNKSTLLIWSPFFHC